MPKELFPKLSNKPIVTGKPAFALDYAEVIQNLKIDKVRYSIFHFVMHRNVSNNMVVRSAINAPRSQPPPTHFRLQEQQSPPPRRQVDMQYTVM